MTWAWKVVPSLGGGLNFESHPAFIDDSQWTWSHGWAAIDGNAEITNPFTQLNDGSWLPASHDAIGLFPDLFEDGSVLLVCRNSATHVIRLFRLVGASPPVEIPVSGTAPTGGTGLRKGIPTLVQLNGSQILWFGVNSTSNYTVARYNGTNFFRIAPTKALRARFVTSAGGHLIAAFSGGDTPTANEARTVLISDAGDPTVWDEATSNSADEILLDTSGVIRGLVTVPDGALIIASERVYRLRTTGGIPSFTLSVEHDGGALDANQYAVSTPHGVFYAIENDLLRLGGGAVQSARRVQRHFHTPNTLGAHLEPLLWHPKRGTVILPITSPAGLLHYDPVTDVWWRMARPGTGATAHTMTVAGTTVLLTGNTAPRHVFMDASSVVYGEQASNSAAVTDAFLHTKDFTTGFPPQFMDIDTIKVDWQPLTNATTDAITITAIVRNHFSDGVLGDDTSGYTDLSSDFVTLGTLTGGDGELKVRLRGKYVRWAFVASSGRARIRGFGFRYQAATDKRAP